MITARNCNGAVLGQILSDGEHLVAHMNDHTKAVLVADFDPLIGKLRISTLLHGEEHGLSSRSTHEHTVDVVLHQQLRHRFHHIQIE